MASLINNMVSIICIAAVLIFPIIASICPDEPVRFDLSDLPFTNYFYSDCNSVSQVVITSPLPDSNLTIIGPRLLVSRLRMAEHDY